MSDKVTFTALVKIDDNSSEIVKIKLKIDSIKERANSIEGCYWPYHEGLIEKAEEYLKEHGFYHYKVDSLLKGSYSQKKSYLSDLEETLDYFRYLERQEQEYLEQQQEENDYMQENYDFEYGDWKY